MHQAASLVSCGRSGKKEYAASVGSFFVSSLSERETFSLLKHITTQVVDWAAHQQGTSLSP